MFFIPSGFFYVVVVEVVVDVLVVVLVEVVVSGTELPTIRTRIADKSRSKIARNISSVLRGLLRCFGLPLSIIVCDILL